jgi:4-alpha-glucanotransferase
MHKTRSYQALDDSQKRALDAVYDDFFYHRHNDLWKASALAKLPVLRDATQMFIYGEDLGMVPACVPEVMRQLELPGMIIQRMPVEDGARFADVARAPSLSVCTPGNHDMSVLREWWEEDRAATQYFYNHVLCRAGAAPDECTPPTVRDIIMQHLQSPSALAIFAWQDLMATDAGLRRENCRDERINVPANPQQYWQYRIHIHIEDLLKETEFNAALREMIRAGGRCQ